MAATGYTPIQLYYSTTASATPAAGNLLSGELAINITDGKLYYKDNAGAVQLLSTSTTATGTANGVLYLNGSKVATSGSALTFDGSRFLANGVRIDIDGGTSADQLRLGTDPNYYKIGRNSVSGPLEFYGTQSGVVAYVFGGVNGEFMRLTSTGLGIGTSSPLGKLDARSSNGVIGTMNTSTAAVNNTAQITLAPASAFTGAWATGPAVKGLLENTSSFATAITINPYSGSVGQFEAARFDSSGNLGLGVTPSAWGSAYKSLEVNGAVIQASSSNKSQAGFGNNYYHNGTNYIYSTSNYATSYFQNSGAHTWYTAPSGTAGNAISFTQAMTLDASGNLIIGDTSSSSGLSLVRSGGTTAELKLLQTGSGGHDWRIGSTGSGYGSAGNLIFYDATAGAERARIDSSGNLLVGTTSSAGAGGLTLIPDNSANAASLFWNRANSASTSYVQDFRNNGSTVGYIAYNNTVVVYATTSDYRLKNTIAPMTDALAKVSQLKPVTYKWNADGSDGQGFIAHELAEVFPQAVDGEKDAVDENGNPKYQGIDTSFLVATLTAAIQELKAEFDAYKASHP